MYLRIVKLSEVQVLMCRLILSAQKK